MMSIAFFARLIAVTTGLIPASGCTINFILIHPTTGLFCRPSHSEAVCFLENRGKVLGSDFTLIGAIIAAGDLMLDKEYEKD